MSDRTHLTFGVEHKSFNGIKVFDLILEDTILVDIGLIIPLQMCTFDIRYNGICIISKRCKHSV